MYLAPTENMVKWKINYTLTVSPTSAVKPMQLSFYLQMNSRTHKERERERESPRTHQPITLLSHTHQPQLHTQSDAKLRPPSQAKASLDRAATSAHITLHHRDRTKIASTCSHPLNLTAMLHRCMSLIHHRHHHPRHHPSYPPS